MITNSKTALAYMAGLIDGEGTICIVKRNDSGSRYVARLAVVNCDKRIVEWIEAHFGPYIYTVRRSDPRRRADHRELHVYEAKAEHAENILRAVLPYLVVKREQAELFFKFRRTFIGGLNGGVPVHIVAQRKALHEQMGALNRRGP